MGVSWVFFKWMKASQLNSWALVTIFPFDVKHHASFLQINDAHAQSGFPDRWPPAAGLEAAVSERSPFCLATICFGGTVPNGVNWFVFDSEFRWDIGSPHWLFGRGWRVYRVQEVTFYRNR